MKPVILLIGANGQVGRELGRMLLNVGHVTSLDRQALDLSKPDDIRRTIRSQRPNLIVNAAAYTAVDKAESEEEKARAINAEAPAIMAEEAKKIGAAVLHYSTDYVFDGRKTSPYHEDDPANPQNIYGKTKLEGEQAVQQSAVPHLIFRTAWIYAPEGRNFLRTILRLATQQEEFRIVCDQIGAPTLNVEISRATTDILARIFRSERGLASMAEVSGVYHMTAGGETSWYEFARAILEEASQTKPTPKWLATATNNLPLIARRIVPIATADYPTPAQRPAYSVLSNARLARTFHKQLPDWRVQLHSVFADPLPRIPPQ